MSGNLIRCQNGHLFSSRRYGTVCPYCNIETATKEKKSVEKSQEEIEDILFLGGGASGLRLDCMCKRPEKRQGLPGNGREKFCGTGRRHGYPDFGGQQNRTEKPCGDCIRRKETGEYDFAGGQ